MGNIFYFMSDVVNAMSDASAYQAQVQARQNAIIVSTIIGLVVLVGIIIKFSKQSSKGKDMKNQFNELKLGMTKDDVIKLLGNPDSQMVDEDTESFSWINREFIGVTQGNSMERKITVSFKDGKVCRFGGDNINTSTWK